MLSDRQARQYHAAESLLTNPAQAAALGKFIAFLIAQLCVFSTPNSR